MKNITLFIALICLMSGTIFAQHDHHNHPEGEEVKLPPFRIALLLGHTLIPEQHAQENFFIPSWGLDIEYWFSNKIGLGVHNDLELETFIILDEGGEMDEIERVSPLVMTLDLLYKPWRGLVLQLGPGIEIEKDESYSLFRTGIEYEIEINHHWDLAPTVFYDSRFDGYHTWSIALGVGRRF